MASQCQLQLFGLTACSVAFSGNLPQTLGSGCLVVLWCCCVSGGRGPPPPPAMAAPVQQVLKPSVKLRPFFWSKLPANKDNIWSRVQPPFPELERGQMTALEHLFAQNAATVTPGRKKSTADGTILCNSFCVCLSCVLQYQLSRSETGQKHTMSVCMSVAAQPCAKYCSQVCVSVMH